MSPRWLALLFAGCFILVVIARMPVAAVLHMTDISAGGLSFSRASGTIWNGQIHGLAWRGNDLGSVRIAAQPLALLLGRVGAKITLNADGPASGSASVALSLTGLHLRDVKITADVARLPVLLPLSGKIQLDLVRADLGGRGCRNAEGNVRTDALVDRPAGLAWKGPELVGRISCLNGGIFIPMSGRDGDNLVGIATTLNRDGGFSVNIEARTPDAAVLSVLSAVGFVETGGMMVLSQSGRWI